MVNIVRGNPDPILVDMKASEAGTCITQLEAQGPSRTCTESKQEEEDIGLHILDFTLSTNQSPHTSILLLLLYSSHA